MTNSLAVGIWIIGDPELVGDALQIATLRLKSVALLLQQPKNAFVRLTLAHPRKCKPYESSFETVARLGE